MPPQTLRRAELGNAGGMADLGALLEDRGQTDEAQEWFTRSAELGDPGGMSGLGLLQASRGETDKAEQWFSRAAAQPNSAMLRGMANIGYFHLEGRAEANEAMQVPEAQPNGESAP